ncbi:MAG: hypothetical protein LBT42_01340, partial [Tannerella sp.]|nr:hypothetical protein [Tannerella sp.]
VRFPSCKLQRQNRTCGFLPATCGNKTARAVSFLQLAATKPRVRFNIPQVAATRELSSLPSPDGDGNGSIRHYKEKKQSGITALSGLLRKLALAADCRSPPKRS